MDERGSRFGVSILREVCVLKLEGVVFPGDPE